MTRLSATLYPTIADRYRNGETAAAIAQSLGYSQQNIARILRLMGLTRSDRPNLSASHQDIMRRKLRASLVRIMHKAGYFRCTCGCKQWYPANEISIRSGSIGVSYACHRRITDEWKERHGKVAVGAGAWKNHRDKMIRGIGIGLVISIPLWAGIISALRFLRIIP